MNGRKFIIGIDEVGRGALAGPVVVAAVIIPKTLRLRSRKLGRLRDSKRLTPRRREIWFDYLSEHPSIFYAVARTAPGVIDRVNVTEAANIAATRAFKKLLANHKGVTNKLKVFLDGGLYLRGTPNPPTTKTLVRGDEKINAIKLASIIAKVIRDHYMVRLHKKHPVYSFHKHKGYGTKKHKNAIKKHGPSPTHRLTFL
ncbi:MAG: ribonuclease HII [Patescibacteria group bacterium]|nr:ribonuclease HII [Patescibacteria group bacterium]